MEWGYLAVPQSSAHEIQGIAAVGELKLSGILSRLTGEQYGVWIQVQCLECKCVNFWSSLVGYSPRYGFVKEGKPKWKRCDISKTAWGEKMKKSHTAIWYSESENLVFANMLRLTQIQELFSDCKKQASSACDE